jgi:BioD-like phosphotransacetylase family protein
LDKFGEPVKDMIAGLVNQLKNELGEEFDKEKPEVQPEKKTKTVRSIEEIDKLLKSQILPESEVNKLLDERSQLVKLKTKDILNSDQ